MAERKVCKECMSLYELGHWAYGRERCPACGGELSLRGQGETEEEFTYEHYDSSADIQFDLSGLLSPKQVKETRLLALLGLVLLLLAVGVRVGWVVWDVSGTWWAPLWLEVLVAAMVFLACGLLVWSVRRCWRHRKAHRRS